MTNRHFLKVQVCRQGSVVKLAVGEFFSPTWIKTSEQMSCMTAKISETGDESVKRIGRVYSYRNLLSVNIHRMADE